MKLVDFDLLSKIVNFDLKFLTTLSQTSNIQNCDIVNFSWLNHPTCDNLSWLLENYHTGQNFFFK